MDRAGLQAAFNAAGLSRLLKDLDHISKAAIRLSTTPADEATIPIGTSKFGGTPDLPSTFGWPMWKDLPQSFIAQIRLEDVRDYDTDHMLPQSGLLWFFYDAQQATYGDNPADSGGWSILFSDNSANLQRSLVPLGLPAAGQFKACSISFSSTITLSHAPQLDIPNCDWTQEEQEKYDTLLSTFPSKAEHDTIQDQLLGFPNTLQDDMRSLCQLVSNGITDSNDPRATALLHDALDWQLLLQVDSDEHAGMHWGDAGILYYWIKAADLQTGKFDAAWFVAQSE